MQQLLQALALPNQSLSNYRLLVMISVQTDRYCKTLVVVFTALPTGKSKTDTQWKKDHAKFESTDRRID
eukprot:144704-Amphidinium_carterae.1